jgi:hypothetical protein
MIVGLTGRGFGRWLRVFLVAMFLGSTWDCTTQKVYVDRQLLPLRVSGKWGYADRNAHVVINPKYDFASEFFDGIAQVGIKEKWGLIDRAGREVTTVMYDQLGGVDGVSKMMSFCLGDCGWHSNKGRWGFLRYTDGKVLIHAKYVNATAFSEGLAPVCLGTCFDHDEGELGKDFHTVKATGKWGYVDKDGNEVIVPQFDSAGKFISGLAHVALGQGDSAKDGYIDKHGAFIVGPSN